MCAAIRSIGIRLWGFALAMSHCGERRIRCQGCASPATAKVWPGLKTCFGLNTDTPSPRSTRVRDWDRAAPRTLPPPRYIELTDRRLPTPLRFSRHVLGRGLRC